MKINSAGVKSGYAVVGLFAALGALTVVACGGADQADEASSEQALATKKPQGP